MLANHFCPYCAVDTLWGYTAHSGDTDGSIAFICDAMLQLDRLVPEMDTETLSEEDAFAMKSLLFTIFDTFWQSSHNQRIVLADIFGDKYIEALNKLNEAPHGEITRTCWFMKLEWVLCMCTF